jgi:hypothetical protein
MEYFDRNKTEPDMFPAMKTAAPLPSRHAQQQLPYLLAGVRLMHMVHDLRFERASLHNIVQVVAFE